MTQEDIGKLIGQEEGTELEYKSAKGGFPESFWETFSAFANTHGGIIVFGIKEKDGRLIPDGLDDSQIAKYKKTFWDCAVTASAGTRRCRSCLCSWGMVKKLAVAQTLSGRDGMITTGLRQSCRRGRSLTRR